MQLAALFLQSGAMTMGSTVFLSQSAVTLMDRTAVVGTCVLAFRYNCIKEVTCSTPSHCMKRHGFGTGRFMQVARSSATESGECPMGRLRESPTSGHRIGT